MRRRPTRGVGVVVDDDVAIVVGRDGGDNVAEVEIAEGGDADAARIAENFTLGRHQGHADIGRFIDEDRVAGPLQSVGHFLGDRTELLHQDFKLHRIGPHDGPSR